MNSGLGAGESNKLANAGQRVLDSSTHQLQSAFIQMRSKPPATTFSVKALSFYSNENAPGIGSNNILIQSTDKVNFATHDNNMTTNREEMNEETSRKNGGAADNMRTTASGTLTNLIQSLENTQVGNFKEKPQRQPKKYRMDLGQNVSYKKVKEVKNGY